MPPPPPLQIWDSTPGYGERPFLDTLWTALDEAITLQDCDVYSYKSDGEDDPFGEQLATDRCHLRSMAVAPAAGRGYLLHSFQTWTTAFTIFT